jgi:hypothetical protein
LLLFPFCLIAQNRIKGKVLLNGLAKENINIKNLRNKTFALSDRQGKFEIQANPGDSLFIFSITIQDKYIKIPFNSGDSNLIIQVNPSSSLLNEIVLQDFDMFKRRDTSNTKIKMGLPFKTTARKLTLEERQIVHEKSKTISFMGLFPVIKRNKAIREIERLQSLQKSDYEELDYFKIIKSHINQKTKEKWGFKEGDLHTFFQFCLKDDQFRKLNQQNNTPEVLSYMFRKVDEFKSQQENTKD